MDIYAGTFLRRDRHVSKQQLARSYDGARRPAGRPAEEVSEGNLGPSETGADREDIFSLPVQRILELQVLCASAGASGRGDNEFDPGPSSSYSCGGEKSAELFRFYRPTHPTMPWMARTPEAR